MIQTNEADSRRHRQEEELGGSVEGGKVEAGSSSSISKGFSVLEKTNVVAAETLKDDPSTFKDEDKVSGPMRGTVRGTRKMVRVQ